MAIIEHPHRRGPGADLRLAAGGSDGTPPSDVHTQVRPSPPGRTQLTPAAWILDAAGLHEEFVALWETLGPLPRPRPGEILIHPSSQRLADGDTSAMRERALTHWGSEDPVVVEYISRLDLPTTEEWFGPFDDLRVGQCYRLCLATHLRPVAHLEHTATLLTGLPTLGWSPAEARRVAWGRELGDLATSYDQDGYGPAVALALRHGHKGWLGPDDVTGARQRLRDANPRAFRGRPDLVVACEELWAVLDAAAQSPHPDWALIIDTCR